MILFKKKYAGIHTGLLILRIGIGVSFMVHGYPKIMAGPEGWENLGGAVKNLGITFAPVFWGFMGAFAEFGGGMLLVLGLFFPITCFLLLITMVVATSVHLVNGDTYSVLSHPIESGILFLSLLFTGPGKYSLDYFLGEKVSGKV